MSVLKKTKASFLTESIKDSSQSWTSGRSNEKVVKAIHQEGAEGAGVKRMRLGVAWSLSSLSLLEVATLSRGGSCLWWRREVSSHLACLDLSGVGAAGQGKG